MQVELVRAKELGTSDWRHFEALFDTGSHPAHPMLHPDFARALAEVRDDTFVIFLKREAEVIGYWPVHLRPGRWMRAIGGPFSDVQGPILKPNIALDLQEVLSKAGVRGITLPGLAHDEGLNPIGLRPRQVHLTRLERGWECVLDEQTRQHKRFFKNHWRLDRKLRRDHDVVEFVFDDTRPESLRRLLDLKSQQFRATGRHNVIASAWAQDFIHRLYSQRDRGVSARLSGLFVDGELAAGELNLQSGEYLHGWLTGFDHRFADYSPGHLLVRLILEAMADKGLTTYDAGVGHGHYKKYFSNAEATLWRGTVRSPGSAQTMSGFASAAWRAAEEKGPPAMQSVLAKVRRRSDQILISEPDLSGRLKGFWKAVVK